MLVLPKEILVSGPLWVTERANMYFILQRRKGRGRGLSALIVGTLDSVREVKPPPYRILHQAEGSEIYVLISECLTSQEALNDWHFLERELLPTLADFENPDEATEFITVKVKSIIAVSSSTTSDLEGVKSAVMSGVAAISLEESESLPYKSASERFHRLFASCEDEKLVRVNYIICKIFQIHSYY